MAKISKFVYAYRTNPRFYLYYKHRDMKARVNGKPAGDRKSQLWKGLPICDRPSFIDWAVNDSSFQDEWQKWQDSNFEIRGPTVHRIDREDGYVHGNMTFVSHADKSRKHLGLS